MPALPELGSSTADLDNADLILYGGYNYEPALIKMIQATNNPAPKIAVYEAAVPNPLMAEAHEHEEAEGTEDHEESTATDEDHTHTADEELAPDPHIWHNARNGIQITNVIRDNLNRLAPDQTDQYNQTAQTLTTELTQLDTWIKAQVATIPQASRKLVTTHDAFRYYADAYGFTVAGALSGLSTDVRPSAAHLTDLSQSGKSNTGVPAIFAETTTNPQLIEAVARDANVTVAEPALFIE